MKEAPASAPDYMGRSNAGAVPPRRKARIAGGGQEVT